MCTWLQLLMGTQGPVEMLKGKFLALFRSTLNLEFDIEPAEIFHWVFFPIHYLSP